MSIYTDMPVCDLRQLKNIEAIKQIEGISDIALLILPKNAESDIASALAAIPKSDISSTIYLNPEDELHILNGCSILTEHDFADSTSIIISDGVLIIDSITPEVKNSLIINGVLIIKEKLKEICNLKLHSINGAKIYIDFEQYKLYPNKIEVDNDFLSYLEPNTLIMAGNKIDINQDVSIEALKSKNIKMVAGNKILCNKSIASYIKATAIVGNDIEIKE